MHDTGQLTLISDGRYQGKYRHYHQVSVGKLETGFARGRFLSHCSEQLLLSIE
jgi:hypothetical protein